MYLLNRILAAYRPTTITMVLALLILLIAFLPIDAFAAGTGTALPYDSALETLRGSIKGPVAFSLSMLGIVAAGGMLIFGGDLSGFMRSMVFLVLVIAVIVGADNMVTALGGSAAEVAIVEDGPSLFANSAVLYVQRG